MTDTALPPIQDSGVVTLTAIQLHSRSQRQINALWEITQAVIALAITAAVIYATLIGKESPSLSNAFVLVVSMYLVRTNHQKVGGVAGSDVDSR
jgi:hypothetical protein